MTVCRKGVCVRARVRIRTHARVYLQREERGRKRERYISLAVMETQKRMIKVATAFMYNTFP